VRDLPPAGGFLVFENFREEFAAIGQKPPGAPEDKHRRAKLTSLALDAPLG